MNDEVAKELEEISKKQREAIKRARARGKK